MGYAAHLRYVAAALPVVAVGDCGFRDAGRAASGQLYESRPEGRLSTYKARCGTNAGVSQPAPRSFLCRRCGRPHPRRGVSPCSPGRPGSCLRTSTTWPGLSSSPPTRICVATRSEEPTVVGNHHSAAGNSSSAFRGFRSRRPDRWWARRAAAGCRPASGSGPGSDGCAHHRTAHQSASADRRP